ncbi:copper chaperone PCu(A)C [Uliginosibacterium sp. H1]|uniref:copper chaperone PCu(A)C n=1 Tax=Uliginosibacterium sp. H1 TaxID=3114757 RepID=UPI002E187215|nr:copper chaperone PCu(A)C [Uliginosibacterium sp. H1]
MKNSFKTALGLLALGATLANAPAFAQVAVKDAWIRATVPQQKATGAFMNLTASKDTKLVGASSPLAETTEVHEMRMDGDVMRMGKVDSIALPAGKTVELKSGGYHVMLMGLKAPAKEGDSVPMTLTFESADKRRENVEVKVPVRALTSSGAAPAQGGHKH